MTSGVVRERKTTIIIMVMYPCDGGSTRLEVTPGGGVSAGVRFGSCVVVDMKERTYKEQKEAGSLSL